MGWQDAPIVGAMPAAKPKWADAPAIVASAPTLAPGVTEMNSQIPAPADPSAAEIGRAHV